MKHLIYTTPIATAVILLGAAGVAHADIVTSNDATGDTTSYAGTSNAAVDHMAGETNDGNLEGDTVTHVLRPFYIPQYNADGTPLLDDEGNQVIKTDYRFVPIGTGVTPATIIHN